MELLILIYVLNTLKFITVVLMISGLLLACYWAAKKFYTLNLMDETNKIKSHFEYGQRVTLIADVADIFKKGDIVRLDPYNSKVYLEANGRSKPIPWQDLHNYVHVPETKLVNPSARLLLLGIFLFTLGGLLPNKETATYMAGAYVLQTVATSEEVIEMGNLAYKATMNQLRKWAETSPELNTLIEAYEELETVTTPSN
jgi:hypothetical protein